MCVAIPPIRHQNPDTNAGASGPIVNGSTPDCLGAAVCLAADVVPLAGGVFKLENPTLASTPGESPPLVDGGVIPQSKAFGARVSATKTANRGTGLGADPDVLQAVLDCK